MNPKALTTLEFDKIIARLATLCAFPASRRLALDLQPSSDYAEVLRRQRLTAEGRRALELKPGLSLAAARDIAGDVGQAARGHVLEPAELLDVQATLHLARSVVDTLSRLRVQLPLLAEIAERIADLREIETRIGRTVNQRAEVVDDASPVLAQLRRDARQSHDRLTHRLQQLVSSASNRTALQEPIVTLRDGRYVVPVKAEMRSQLPGIVHDVSSSGATVFLEPLEVVEMGNRWRELQLEEQREVQRILRDLSQAVGERDADIAAAVDALAEIDLSLAKARLGEALRASELPHDGMAQRWLVEGGGLRLEEARHPLLTGDVVPITAWVGEGPPSTFHLPPPEEGFTVLLITGPNTGGKTVALKTVGLLALMAQAGLPVPAGGDSRLPVFEGVYADIGDEQSIEQSLSTFSSHMGNIIAILRAASPRSLVLLDELGAGTDPAEGSALAKAILHHLLRSGCLTIATTHHGELKAFAHVTPGVANASVEFDPQTLAPAYRLTIGLPGQSNALAIAARLGMPEELLAEARQSIGPDRLAVETLIVDLARQRDAAEIARFEQETAAARAQQAEKQVSERLAALESGRERLLEQTRREMEEQLAQARARLHQAARDMERAARLPAPERAVAVEAAQQEIEAVEKTVEKLERRRRRRRGPLPPIEPGDLLYLRDLPLPGEALSAPDDQGEVEVKLGALRARISLRQVERVDKGMVEPVTFSPARPEALEGRARAVSPELDVRGLAADEALLLVDQRLDEAFRAGLAEVRIVHGKGTGTLRRAVREMLSKHALVRAHASAPPRAGGDGVTVAELAT
ncbi:MAG: endonuclease MutS2 [Dehalococcoidia bacterium]|nr:endonuclease MutS2 [Dehalococcoidia bacterium]